jgi:hypothetical protein
MVAHSVARGKVGTGMGIIPARAQAAREAL